MVFDARVGKLLEGCVGQFWIIDDLSAAAALM
jgi:hypothetical protein